MRTDKKPQNPKTPKPHELDLDCNFRYNYTTMSEEWEEGSDGWGEEPDQPDQEDAEIENNYYMAEGDLKTAPDQALEQFETVIMLEENESEKKFTFSATKYIILLSA